MNNGNVNVAIYARYSSDIQNPSSVDDQIKTCTEIIKNKISDNANIYIFSDSGISGASMANRGGILSMLDAIRRKEINIVVAEGLDRISRSISDTAFIYDLTTYYNVKLFTIQEGYLSLIEASLKGMMNQIFLKDLSVKIRRGQVAKVEKGLFITVPPYGYRLKLSSNGRHRAKAGEREIIPEEAAIIRRIFQEYVDGRKLVQIVRDLNKEGIPSPRGSYWRVGTILCKGSGILRHDIYHGCLVYGKTKNNRDFVSGKKRLKFNPRNEWRIYSAPEMRIIDDELWEKAQDRINGFMVKNRKNVIDNNDEMRNLKRHFTGYVKCGVCGSKKHVGNKLRYVCCRARYKASCDNARGTEEHVISNTVFSHIKDHVKRNSINIHNSILRKINIKINLKKETEGKISALLDCVDMGVNLNIISEKLIKLQNTLNDNYVPKEIYKYIDMSSDDVCQFIIERVDNIKSIYNIDDVRFMLECLVKEVVLVPIPGQYRGENIIVNLNKIEADGWYKFLLAGKG